MDVLKFETCWALNNEIKKSDKNNGTKPQFVSHSAQSFLEWELFQTDIVEKNKKKHILGSLIFFFLRKLCRLGDYMEKIL